MNLKEYMFYTNKSQRDMAKKLDITNAYLCRIMNGDVPMSKKVCQKIEMATEGYVTAETIIGPYTHQALK